MASTTATAAIFEDYFRRADLDRDGRISGLEAVSFFRGANLPQATLAKIWQLADAGGTGFLLKPSFYNALKLVTVAQTGRELTPELVQAALTGPAGAQIPPPRIGGAASVPQPSNLQAAPSVAPRPPHDQPSRPGLPPRQWSSQPSSLPGASNISAPPPAIPKLGSVQRPPVSTDTWPSIRSSSGGVSAAAQKAPVGNQTGPTFTKPPGGPGGKDGSTGQTSLGAKPPSQARNASPAGKGLRPPPENGTAGNKSTPKSAASFTSSSLVDAFLGDPFAATPIAKAQDAAKALTQGSGQGGAPTNAQSRDANLMDFQPVGPPDSRPGGPVASAGIIGQGFGATAPPAQGFGDTPPPAQGFGATPPPAHGFGATPPPAHGFGAIPPPLQGFGAGQVGGVSWPRMTPSDVQRYTRVFAAVDTDRDGLVSGDQARDLFLSWRLPREVLKQVWDLSDQDGDRMLSMREFCTSLYFMERFREGRQLPAALPPGIFADDQQPANYSAAITHMEQPRAPYNVQGYGLPNGQQNLGTGFASGNPSGAPAGAGNAFQPPNSAGHNGDNVQAAQNKSKAPGLELHLVNQLSRDEQDTLQSRHKDAEEANKKANDLDKEIMDYKEKAEFYRTKLQEIILFKSRCENRLGEITERAAADKREMESLAKKYDERFKVAGEANSRLQAEEAVFRDVQERKIELFNAISKMHQGGDSNGLLQSKADRISHDLDELRKAFNERAKRLGLSVKSTVITDKDKEFGWVAGIQENAAEWDEDWDNFDDEGFVTFGDIADGEGGGRSSVSASNKQAASLLDEGFASSPKSMLTLEITRDTPSVPGQGAFDDVASPTGSNGLGQSEVESPELNMPKASKSLGPPSFDSGGETFDNGGVSSVFGHDDDSDSAIRASWGLQGSQDLTSSRTSRFGKVGLSSSDGFGDVHHGNGKFQDSDEEDGFGQRGASKVFDRSASLFKSNNNAQLGSTLFDSPRKSTTEDDWNLGRFDSLASPGNDPASGRSMAKFDSFANSQRYSPRHGEKQRDSSFFGAGKDDSPRRDSSFFGTGKDDSPRRDNSSFGSGKDYTDRGFGRFDSFTGPRSTQRLPDAEKEHQDNSFSGGGKDYTDRGLSRYDSLSSPRSSPPYPGLGEDGKDNSFFGAGKDLNDNGLTRFDSFGGLKNERGGGRGRIFESFDDKDDLFGGNGTGQEKKTYDSWNGF